MSLSKHLSPRPHLSPTLTLSPQTCPELLDLSPSRPLATWPPHSRTSEVTLRIGARVGDDGDSGYRGSVAADTGPSFSLISGNSQKKRRKSSRLPHWEAQAASPVLGGGRGQRWERPLSYSKGDFFTSWQLQAQRVCLGGKGMSLIAQAVAVRGKQK